MGTVQETFLSAIYQIRICDHKINIIFHDLQCTHHFQAFLYGLVITIDYKKFDLINIIYVHKC